MPTVRFTGEVRDPATGRLELRFGKRGREYANRQAVRDAARDFDKDELEEMLVRILVKRAGNGNLSALAGWSLNFDPLRDPPLLLVPPVIPTPT